VRSIVSRVGWGWGTFIFIFLSSRARGSSTRLGGRQS
jgi:hypothetical protein